jgi:uncharacterized damage-inducible protein DinB
METTAIESNVTSTPVITITPDQLLSHWLEHRRLTKRAIEAFPETELFSFSIGGMRTFADLVMEMIDIAGPGAKGIATGDWSGYGADGSNHTAAPATKEELLQLWDDASEKITIYWPQIRPERFQENDVAFGQYEGIIYSSLLYFIDNEIHHRAQGYVYLRALNIQPPFFWDRR